MTKPLKVEITKKILRLGKSSNNGWSRNQILLLGEDMNERGWKKRLMGKLVDADLVQEFLDLKDNHLRGSLEEKTLTRKARQKEMKRIRNFKRDLANFVPAKGQLSLKEQYEHPNWQRLRIVVLSRDEYVCKYCGNDQEQLHVHHLKYTGTNIWDTEIKYLVTLCKSCHKKQHSHMK